MWLYLCQQYSLVDWSWHWSIGCNHFPLHLSIDLCTDQLGVTVFSSVVMRVCYCIYPCRQTTVHLDGVTNHAPNRTLSSPLTVVIPILVITVRHFYHTLSSHHDSSWWLLYWPWCCSWQFYVHLTLRTLRGHPCSESRHGYSRLEGGSAR